MRLADLFTQVMLSVMIAVFLIGIILSAILVGYNLYFAGRVFPGVSVGGVDLSGLSTEQAAVQLSQHLTYQLSGKVGLKDGDRMWVAAPSQVGLFLNPNASAVQALNWGRRGGFATRIKEQFQAWYRGTNLPTLLVYDERIGQGYLNQLASQINRPSVEASLSINGLEVVVQPGQIGRTLDIPTTLADLRSQVQSMQDGIVPLTIIESSPAILDVSQHAEIARRILSEPLKIQIPEWQEGDPGPWTFAPEEVAQMLVIERISSPQGDSYQVGLDSESLRPILMEAAPALSRTPENAKFIFNDDTRELEVIQPAVIGRTLLIDETIKAINENVREGNHEISVDFDYTLPAVTDDATAESLGITELVSEHTSYFYGSSGSRIQNIATASSRFHGVLVPPGATFSMADVLGDVSLDNGYAEALIIFGDRTIKGVGGGVCQVSTTLFRTVFFGGFPIVERHPHAYRVSYYELRADGSVNPRYAGLDATVFVPVVDFKFTNDTSDWLLMETYVNQSARTLTWKFYSTSDGRTVDWDTTGPKDIVEPPEPLYQENPDLAKGEIRQVDWEADGADVTVTRTVYRDGQVYLSDQIYTHYLSWRAVYDYGPGTKIPKDKKDKDE